MYQSLLAMVQDKPNPYAASTAKFWNDPHISKSMLQAHLDPESEAATRNPAFVAKSAAWIASMVTVPEEKALLDLGCGPGIYAERFAACGFTVTGMDFSPRSLEYARRSAADHGAAIDYVLQDYLKLDMEKSIDVITLIYCDYGVLSPQNRTLLLWKIRKALKPGGIFIVDVWNRHWGDRFQQSEEVNYEHGGFWKAEPYLCITRHFRYDPLPTFLDQYIVVTADRCDCFNVWETAFDPVTLGDELRQAGFVSTEFYGDVAGSSVSGTGDTLCAVAR